MPLFSLAAMGATGVLALTMGLLLGQIDTIDYSDDDSLGGNIRIAKKRSSGASLLNDKNAFTAADAYDVQRYQLSALFRSVQSEPPHQEQFLAAQVRVLMSRYNVAYYAGYEQTVKAPELDVAS